MMSNARDEYLAKQKEFWNADDPKVLMFERVCTLDPALKTGADSIWEKDAESSLARILNGIAVQSNWHVLELGCGVGRLIKLLLERTAPQNVIGVDISESMIREARKYLDNDPRVRFFATTGQDLTGIGDETVDFAYSVDVFIHIHDVDVVASYLREIRRVLKPGAQFRFNVRWFDVNRSFGKSLGGRFARLIYQLGLRSTGRHRWIQGDGAELNGNLYQVREIRDLIEKAGLVPVELDPVHGDQVGNKIWCIARKA